MTDRELKALREQLSDVYRDYRNVYLTKKAYEHEARRVERLNRAYEIFLAIGTSGTIAGWALWKDPSLANVWPVIGGVVAILSVVKPILGLSSKIERLTSITTHYASLHIDFQVLMFEIRRKQAFDDVERATYFKLLEKIKAVGPKDDPVISKKLHYKLFDEVNREIPPESLWSPE
jgi:hypothetical protein